MSCSASPLTGNDLYDVGQKPFLPNAVVHNGRNLFGECWSIILHQRDRYRRNTREISIYNFVIRALIENIQTNKLIHSLKILIKYSEIISPSKFIKRWRIFLLKQQSRLLFKMSKGFPLLIVYKRLVSYFICALMFEHSSIPQYFIFGLSHFVCFTSI